MDGIKLSIYIPTYNRCEKVINQLNFLIREFKNLGKKQELVEIVISDNCSDDNTYESVIEYINDSGISKEHLRAYKNSANIGIIGNAYKSVELTYGQFLWLVSDDDILVAGVVNKVLQILTLDVDAIYLNTMYTYKVRDFTCQEIRYSDKECLLKKPKDYMLSNFWQRSSRMGLITSLVFDRRYMEIAKDIIPLNQKESYGWILFVPMVIACEGNVYLTEDIWVKLVNSSNSWSNIRIDAFTGCALSILKLNSWYSQEEIELMFKVYEENIGIVKIYVEDVGLENIYLDDDYVKCYEMAKKCNSKYV